VLGNLLANATDAVPEGRAGKVEVRAERRTGAVRITVSDNGAGMPPVILRRAFEPFFTTKPEARGRGIGLAISRGVVEGSGGALWLESEPGDTRGPGAARATATAARRYSVIGSTRTRASPRSTIPSRAAANDRSTTRPRLNGPRSVTVTTTVLPFSSSVTELRAERRGGVSARHRVHVAGAARVRRPWNRFP
jgi:signal transduction histidine kinase